MSTKIVSLKKGLKIGKDTYQSITLHTPGLGEMMDAEEDANPQWRPLSYRVALAARCVDSAGGFSGPFTAKMLRSIDPEDWRAISNALVELESEGEDLSSAGEDS